MIMKLPIIHENITVV